MTANPVTWFTISSLFILTLLEASNLLKAEHKGKQLDESESLDELRMSSLNRFETGNYHTIQPRTVQQPAVRSGDDVMNQIGKPLLVALPPTQQQQQQQRYKQNTYSQQAAAAKKLRPVSELRQVTTSAPRPPPVASQWIEPDFLNGASDQTSSRQSANQAGSCRWIPLRDMKSVSFDTGEIIIRDFLDQPCYIISIRAYIKFDEDSYFPLRDFRPYPNGAYRIDPYSSFSTNNGTGSGAGTSLGVPAGALKVPPLNCSLPDNIVASQLVADFYLFKEEIIIQVNCGYLVLQTRLDTANQLWLASMAFYQDAAAAAVSTSGPLDWEQEPAHSRSAQFASAKTPPSMQSEHLVFSIVGAGDNAGSSSGTNEPLVVMPMFSRYICQQRVVLTGNNSVQLVIERLEFKRLTGLPGGVLVKSPPRPAHGSATTRCPGPAGPGNFSTSLMARNSAPASPDGDTWPPTSKPSSNKWTSSASSPSSSSSSCLRCSLILLIALIVLEARKLVVWAGLSSIA